MTNSQNMTLEDRIVQTLKDDKLMALVGDEDAIRELVTRALREALFEERTVKDGYNTKRVPSAVVNAANEAAKKVATEVAEKMVAELLADERVRKTIFDVLPQVFVRALAEKALMSWDQFRDQASFDAVNRIQSAMAGRF